MSAVVMSAMLFCEHVSLIIFHASHDNHFNKYNNKNISQAHSIILILLLKGNQPQAALLVHFRSKPFV